MYKYDCNHNEIEKCNNRILGNDGKILENLKESYITQHEKYNAVT